jgi:hypothetical protein
LVEKTDKGILLSSTLNPLTNGYEIVTPLEVEKRDEKRKVEDSKSAYR